MNVANRLQEIIHDSGVSYTYIAKKTGITTNAISRSLSGKRRLSAEELVAICSVMQIDINNLKPFHTITQKAPPV